jgi:hypothetical protein
VREPQKGLWLPILLFFFLLQGYPFSSKGQRREGENERKRERVKIVGEIVEVSEE